MKVLRHVNCLDMDLLVLKTEYDGWEHIKLKVKYINRKGRLLHPDSDTVVVSKADLWKWSVII